MANLQRLVKNVCNCDREVHKVFESIAKKHNIKYLDELGANTAVPNQVFASRYNRLKQFSQVIFLDGAYKMLDNIREIDHLCTAMKASKGKNHGDIKFACFGYRDFDGDIVITHISCPIIEEAYNRKFSTDTQFLEFISRNTTSAEFNMESASQIYDYLRNSTFKGEPIGNAVVGLIGHTKHEQENSVTSNCFKLSELAEAVIPQIPIVSEEIMSGVISITPKTINSAKLYSKKKLSMEDCLEDGSLECAIISYQKNPNTGTVSPTTIQDIKQAIGYINNKQYSIKISSSLQPTNELYHAKQISNDYTM